MTSAQHPKPRRASALRPALKFALGPLAAAAAMALSAAPQAASATTYTWTGQSSNFWSSSLNWLGNSAPPADGLTTADIVFGTSNAVAPSLSSPYSVHSLTFNSGASAYSFSLNALTVGYGGINQNASNAQTFSNKVVLGDNQTWYLASGAGALNFNGGVNTTGGPGNANRDLTINAATTTGSGNVVGGVISGGGSLYKTGAGILTLTGASTYSGSTYVKAGTLAIGNGGQIAGANLEIDNGTTLALGGTGSVAPSGYLVVDGTLNMSGSASLSTGVAIVGDIDRGTFNLSGGSFTTNGNVFQIGANASGNTFNLSGSGSLSTGVAYLGNGSNFYQSGGSFTTNGAQLTVYGNANFNQSGGSLISGSVLFGDGSINLSGGSFTAGSVDLGRYSGTFNLNGGTLAVGVVTGQQGTGSFNFNGGTLRASQSNPSFMQGLTTVNVQSGGAKIDTNGFNVTIAQDLLHDTSSGAAASDGGLTKLGSGTLTLTGDNSYTGDTTVSAGTLILNRSASLYTGGASVASGALLRYAGAAVSAGFNGLTAVSGGTIEFTSQAQLTGGTLDGLGTYTFGSGGARLLGTTINNGAHVAITGGPTSFRNVVSSGAVSVAAGQTLTWTGGRLDLGSLALNGTANVSGWASTGVVTVNNGAFLTNNGSNLVLGGGSRTTVNSGGTLVTGSGTSIELNGGLLVNNGTLLGTLNVNYGSTAKGSGSFGAVNVADGGKFSPGNSPGTANAASFSFGAGGRYDFELNAASATAGVGADLLKVADTLFITAGSTANSVFTIGVNSLNLANQAAALTDFNSSLNYHWLLVDANAVSGFDSAKFDVDTSGFSNSLNGGSFKVSLNGNDLYLDYTPAAVPEPASWALGLMGAAVLAGWRGRRARRQQPPRII